MMARCFGLLVGLLSIALSVRAQENAGAPQFARNCAGCHGADGRGSDKAPAIATMPTVVALSDEQLIKIVHEGTPTGMPAFPQLDDASTRAVIEYLRTLQGKTSAGASSPITGNVDNGLALFFGKAQCSNCHMVDGKGGFIAQDLNAYGKSHSAEVIIKTIVTPDVPLSATSRVVEVRTKGGEQLLGMLRFEDNFNLELQTQDGQYHFLDRSSLADVKYTDHSLMPRDYGNRLTQTELNDIASYLILAARNAPQAPPKRRGGDE
jgi:cytochrome c oxidase cbb3-type subunit III